VIGWRVEAAVAAGEKINHKDTKDTKKHKGILGVTLCLGVFVIKKIF
jgi:hypothetical protein